MADLNGPELAITDTPACKDAIRSDGKKKGGMTRFKPGFHCTDIATFLQTLSDSSLTL